MTIPDQSHSPVQLKNVRILSSEDIAAGRKQGERKKQK